MKTYITGSRQLSNIFWAIAVTIGGYGFFLTGLSSYFKVNFLLFSDVKELTFVPQGITLLFYGSVGLILGIFLCLTILWDVGSGYNEYNKKLKKVFLQVVKIMMILHHGLLQLKKLNTIKKKSN